MKKITKHVMTMMTASSLCLGSLLADLAPDYDKGSEQLGKDTLVDQAKKGGGDFALQGRAWWVAAANDLWKAGDKVTITGIAIPIRGDTTAPNVITFTFYDIGSDDNFDPAATVVGTAEEAYPGGETGVWYAKFDEPITFTAHGSGVAVGFASKSGTMFLKVSNQQSAPGIFRKAIKNGEPVVDEFPNFAMTLAGTVEPGKK